MVEEKGFMADMMERIARGTWKGQTELAHERQRRTREEEKERGERANGSKEDPGTKRPRVEQKRPREHAAKMAGV